MPAFDERRSQDIQKLHQLAGQTAGRMIIGRITGNPPNKIHIEFRLKTAASKKYPSEIQEVTRFTIGLPSRYPFVSPEVKIDTPILHPNVYASGLVCLGVTWMPTFGLEHLVKRLAQIVIFDSTILNEASPANGAALDWYRKAIRENVSAFPTDKFIISDPSNEKKIAWTDVPKTEIVKAIVSCPSCEGRLSLPAGRSGKVKCPRCNHSFEANT